MGWVTQGVAGWTKLAIHFEGLIAPFCLAALQELLYGAINVSFGNVSFFLDGWLFFSEKDEA